MPGESVSVVVPLLNEEASLPVLLESIANQTRPPDRVIFVDGGSRDGTVPTLRTKCMENRGWELLVSPGATPGRGRNVGIDAAQTEWVALTDAGIALDAHWLERLLRAANAEPDVDIVYGHYEPAKRDQFSSAAALAYVEVSAQTGRGPMRGHSIASCLLRREVWEQVGGFPDLRASEDRLFMRRVRELGFKTALAPEAVVHWQLPANLRSTFKRFRTYSKVNAQIGEQRHWHYGVARMYLAAAPFVIVAALHRRRWLLVPVAGGFARVWRSVWSRRAGRGVLWAVNPRRLGTVGIILLTTDLATFAGWIDAKLERPRKV